MKITRRQLRRIIKEAMTGEIHGNSPYAGAGNTSSDQSLEGWSNPAGAEFPITFGYTDKSGEEVKITANNAAESDEFFHTFWKEYGYNHPYSVN